MSFNEMPGNIMENKNNLSHFGEQTGPTEESEKFPGAKILSFTDSDQRIKRFALSRDASGKLQGTSFEMQEYAVASGEEGYWQNSSARVDAEGMVTLNGKDMPKYRVGPTYQMHQDELENMEQELVSKGITI